MEYIVENTKYTLSYQELREEYLKHVEMDDAEFMNNLPSALHLACVICFLKETPSYLVLSDKGIIHQLTHLIHLGVTPLDSVRDVRLLFESQLNLVP